MTTISELFGSMVFNDHVMQERLPKATYKLLAQTIKEDKPLDPDVANVVAHAMKEWAIEKGATHYTHWFQPLTGITSEKHDSFITPQPDGRALMSFSGKELIQGEPDASSFPSGGLRATFEARGYTAWDPTSYAFIKDNVLCIPTAFVSYGGEALDKKTPLLRSMDAISREAKRVLALFGKSPIQVSTTVGPEQEYFLIKEEDYADRLDLILTGRTLFGTAPCKGQELEEHYFGSIRPTVNRFMEELVSELWMLGVPAKTKHNEVAPSQHELAPIFQTTNAAIDANLLTMELMRKIASRHGLVCLQHEKPFEGINGNGKHNNWSISADGVNLLDPGSTPFENLQFLVFLTAVIKAVDEYQGLLRMSVASAGNDHRLGANEAPPAIISIFLGDELEAVVRAIINAETYTSNGAKTMDLGVPVLPTFIKDNTDRNRTSPFAFTGNKFEFRMAGAEVNLSDANMVLNTIIAKTLADFADVMDGSTDFERDAKAYMRQTLTEHQRIIFNGDNYSDEWPNEAMRRKLLNLKSTPEALPQYVAPESIELFERFGVLSRIEVESRYEVKLEHYSKKVNIEGLVTARMARARFIPAIVEYSTVIATSIATKKDVSPALDTSAEEKLLTSLAAGINTISAGVEALESSLSEAASTQGSLENARAYLTKVLPAMNAVRVAVDEMEVLVGHDYWPVPSYNHMLFYT
ncbi:MAG: glutamine synthetase III [Coriobacteriales bacterium]|jgi:glutamine synthetase|nr:glutamine synthetase III [Coriobacteriales bacterium]